MLHFSLQLQQIILFCSSKKVELLLLLLNLCTLVHNLCTHRVSQCPAVTFADGGDEHAAQCLTSAVQRQAAAGSETHGGHAEMAEQHGRQVQLGLPAVWSHRRPQRHLQRDHSMSVMMFSVRNNPASSVL